MHKIDPSRMNRARGFTLAELLVAVAAVLLLTIGIGQLFGNVGKLVSTGAAVSEVDQLARAIEKQIRDDFAGMSAMKTGDTLLAIRSRTLGDRDRNGIFDNSPGAGEAALHLTLADLEADEREGLASNPYVDVNGDGEQDGRGVTVRLDEVLFLSFGGEQNAFVSAEETGDGTIITAPVARVYYGHGLKPMRRPVNYDVAGGPTYLARPPFLNPTMPDGPWIPDGDFGQPLRDPNSGGAVVNRYYAGENVQGRNEFAGEFVLTRQALLLYGGLAAGYEGAQRPTPVGHDREVALTVRDSDNTWFDVGANRLGPSNPFVRPGRGQRQNLPTLTLLSMGRTDICAQSPESLKRWLEGFLDIDPGVGPGQRFGADASALDGGYFDLPAPVATSGSPPPNPPDDPLWARWDPDNNPGPESQRLAENLKGLQSAIAGMFGRMLVESDPPVVVRESVPVASSLPGGMRAEDALMDLHATLAARCSSFEVAWSDGTLWNSPNNDLGVDLDEQNPALRLSSPPAPEADIVYKPGDIIWFDADFPRRLLSNTFPSAYPQSNDVQPEILSDFWSPGERANRLQIPAGAGVFMQSTPEYDPLITGGDPDGNEYLAIWGYRKPEADGVYDTDWPKPQLLRFRMTLHDAQFRIAKGKTFEFIVSIDTK